MRKYIVLLLTACLWVNCLHIRAFSLSEQPSAVLAMESRFVLQFCSSLAAIPVKIVSTLFAGSTIPDTEGQDHRKEASKSADSSTEFSLQSQSIGKYFHGTSYQGIFVPAAGAGCGGFSRNDCPVVPSRSKGAAAVQVALLLLLLCSLLPRGSIESFCTFFLHEHFPRGPVSIPDWVFYCGKRLSFVTDIAGNFTKATAVITLLCFVYSSVCSQALYALVDPGTPPRMPAPAMDGLNIPYSAGRITDAHFLGSDTVVIAIQDLHCHSEVQKNISALLRSLDEQYGLKKVYVEGGVGNIDTSWSNLFKGEKEREQVIGTLLEGGMLTGAEYFSLASGKQDILAGMEDEKPYLENLQRLQEIVDKRRDIEQLLPQVRDEMALLDRRYFSSRNTRLQALLRKNRSGGITSEKYFRTLMKYADKAGVDFSRYPALNAFLDVMDMQKRLRYPKISRQLQEYMASLKQRLPYAAYSRLQEKSRDAAHLEELYVSLSAVAQEYHIDLAHEYPELAKFFAFIEHNRTMNPVAVVTEERQLVAELHGRNSSSRSEQEAAFLMDSFGYLEDYLTNRISADDYRHFRQTLPLFKTLWQKYVASDGISSLEAYYPLFDAFYQVNVERNSYFIRNICGASPVRNSSRELLTPKIDHYRQTVGSLRSAKNIIVVVTGGFHTPGLTQLLTQQGISYLVITPNITRDTLFSDRVYEQLAKEGPRLFASQTIALQLYSQKLLGLTDNEKVRKITVEAVESELRLLFRHNAHASEEDIARAMDRYSRPLGGSFSLEPGKYPANESHFIYAYRQNGENVRLSIVYDRKDGTARVAWKVRELRDASRTLLDEMRADHLSKMNTTPPARFRELAHAVTDILVAAAAKDIDKDKTVVVLPWRAALSMANGFEAAGFRYFWHDGLKRDEATLQTIKYYQGEWQLPKGVPASEVQAVIADPMSGTGNTIVTAIEQLLEKGIQQQNITVVNIINVPEAADRIHARYPRIRNIITAALDEKMVDSFISPGLGDFGDRYFEGLGNDEIEQWQANGILSDNDVEALRERMAEQSEPESVAGKKPFLVESWLAKMFEKNPKKTALVYAPYLETAFMYTPVFIAYFIGMSLYAGSGGVLALLAAVLGARFYADGSHEYVYTPGAKEAHRANDEERAFIRDWLTNIQIFSSLVMLSGMAMLPVIPVTLTAGGLNLLVLAPVLAGYLVGVHIHRELNRIALYNARTGRSHAESIVFKPLVLLVGTGKLAERIRSAHLPGQKKLDEYPTDIVADALETLSITLEEQEGRTVRKNTIDPRAVAAITGWLKANIGTATDEQLDAALAVLEKHLRELGLSGKSKAIDKILKGIREDREKAAADRKTVNRFEGTLTEIVTIDNRSIGVSDPGLAHLLGPWHRASYGFLVLPSSKDTPHHVLLIKTGPDSKYPSQLSTMRTHVEGSYNESLFAAVASQLGLPADKAYVRNYWWQLVGEERSEEGNDNEIRRVFAHELRSDELKILNGKIKALRQKKAGMTVADYEVWSRGEEAHRLFGDVREFYVVDIDDLVNAPQEQVAFGGWNASRGVHYLELEENFKDAVVESRVYFAPDSLDGFVDLYTDKVYQSLTAGPAGSAKWYRRIRRGGIIAAALGTLLYSFHAGLPSTPLYYSFIVGLTLFGIDDLAGIVKKLLGGQGKGDDEKASGKGKGRSAETVTVPLPDDGTAGSPSEAEEETGKNDKTAGLLRNLSSYNPGIRLKAIIALGEMGKRGEIEAGDELVIKRLIKAMKADNFKQVFTAIVALNPTREQMIAAAYTAFSLESNNAKSYAIFELDQRDIIDEDLQELYRKFLVMGDSQLAVTAIYSLERAWDERSLEPLLQVVRLPDTNITALISLERLGKAGRLTAQGHQEVVDAVISSLTLDNFDHVMLTLWALKTGEEQIRNEKLRALYREVRKETDRGRAKARITKLAEQWDEHALEFLLKYVETPETSIAGLVQLRRLNGKKEIEGEEQIDAVDTVIKSLSPGNYAEALLTLHDLKAFPEQMIEAYTAMLHLPYVPAQLEAVNELEAIGRTGNDEGMQAGLALMQALSPEQPVGVIEKSYAALSALYPENKHIYRERLIGIYLGRQEELLYILRGSHKPKQEYPNERRDLYDIRDRISELSAEAKAESGSRWPGAGPLMSTVVNIVGIAAMAALLSVSRAKAQPAVPSFSGVDHFSLFMIFAAVAPLLAPVILSPLLSRVRAMNAKKADGGGATSRSLAVKQAILKFLFVGLLAGRVPRDAAAPKAALVREIAPELEGKDFFVSSPYYSADVSGYAAQAAEDGLAAFYITGMTAVPEGTSLIDLNDRDVQGNKAFSRASLTVDGRTILLNVRAGQNGNVWNFFYYPVQDKNDPLSDAELRLVRARAPLAVIRWLMDTPAVLNYLGISRREFRPDIVMTTDPLGHALAVQDSMNDGITFRDTVFILHDGEERSAEGDGLEVQTEGKAGGFPGSIDLAALRKTFDIVSVKEAPRKLLELAGKAYRRKKEVPPMPLVPVFSQTVNLGKDLTVLQRMAETAYLHEQAEMQTDSIVLEGLQELLKTGDREKVEQLLRKVLALAGTEKIRLFFDYEYDGSTGLEAAEREIAWISSLGFNGARFGLDLYTGNKDAGTVSSILKALKQAVGETNADAMAAVFLPAWDTGNSVVDRAETLGLKPAQRYLPGMRPKLMRQGVWLEMSMFKYAYDPATGQTKREDFEYDRSKAELLTEAVKDLLDPDNGAGIVGVNTGAWWEDVKGQLNAASGADGFKDFIIALLSARYSKLDRDPVYQFTKGRDLAWRLAQTRVPAVDNEVKREILGLLDAYAVLSNDAANRENMEALARQLNGLAGMPALETKAWEEAVSLLNDELQLLNGSDQQEERYLHASYIAGYVRGIIERSMVKEEIQDRQFVSPELEKKYGWLLVEASMMIRKGPLPLLSRHPELLETDPDLVHATTVIKALEADAQKKDVSIIALQPRLKLAVNLLWLIVQKKDTGNTLTRPAAISELLRILYLYADKEVSFKDRIGNSMKVTAPAAVESLLSAA